MQIKPEYQLKNIAGDYVVVATGAAVVDLTGSFTLNESAAFLWRTLEKGAEKEALVDALTAEYAVDKAQAEADIEEFIAYLREKNILE